jgi:hypothetical protein
VTPKQRLERPRRSAARFDDERGVGGTYRPQDSQRCARDAHVERIRVPHGADSRRRGNHTGLRNRRI